MILGIDLGTTYSAVATVEDGHPARVLPNGLGELTTPSAVSFLSATDVLVGQLAKDRCATDPEETVTLIKRRMGTDFPLEFHGQTHTPESVSSVLLRALVADARAALGAAVDEPVRAVITVPAYFGLREREATQQAAALAGIEVLELVAEPVAAALHYGVADTTNRTVLVYDLGGGTFDCSVLRSEGGSATVLATDGDSALGGADVDERIVATMLDRLAEQLPDDADDPADDVEVVQEVMNLAEAAKRSLGSRQSQRVTIRHAGVRAQLELDQALLQSASADLVDRTLAIVERLLTTVGADIVIDEVLLVGGSSRLPAVRQAIEARFGRKSSLVDPELAVALGAAVRAHRLTQPSVVAGLADVATQAVAVLPRGVGVLVRDSHDPAGLREFVQHVLKPNTPLPATATASFATILPNQSVVRIQVYEQAGAIASAEVEHNRRVLDGELTGLPELPAGARVDVTLGIGPDGLLTVTAREVLGGTELALEAYVDGVVDRADVERLAADTGAMIIRQ